MADQAQSNGIGVELDGEFRTPESAIATGIGVEIDGGFHTPGSAICTGIGIELDVVPPFPTGAAVKGVVNAREAIVGEASPPTRMDVKVGNSADLLSAEVPFDALVCEVIVLVEANDFEMLFVDEWGNDGPLFTVRKGTSRSFTAEVRGFKHRNKVAGQVAGYEIIGLYHHYPDPTWPEKMLSSYIGLNSHDEFTDVAKLELLARLQPGGYLYNTFGPPGTNETVCDFLKLFTFGGDMVARTMAKTGVALRWDIDGAIHNQDDWPAHVRNPLLPNVVTVTTADGWSGLTRWYMFNNNLDGVLPTFNDCVNLRYFDNGINVLMTGPIPSFGGCLALYVFSVSAGWPGGQHTGLVPSFLPCTNLAVFNLAWNDFSGETPLLHSCSIVYLYLIGNAFTTHARDVPQVSRVHMNAQYNSLNQQAIDNYLLDYEGIKTPMALSGNNYSILLNSNASGPSVIGLVAKQALIAEFAATPGAGTLTITHD